MSDGYTGREVRSMLCTFTRQRPAETLRYIRAVIGEDGMHSLQRYGMHVVDNVFT